MSEYDKLIKGHTVKAVALTLLVLRRPLVCNCVVVGFFLSYSKTYSHVTKSRGKKNYLCCFNYHTLYLDLKSNGKGLLFAIEN